jgi:spore coat protein H
MAITPKVPDEEWRWRLRRRERRPKDPWGAACAAFAALAVAGCGVQPEGAPPPEVTTTPELANLSAEAFDDARLRTWRLTFAPADWQTLRQTALEEKYVVAQLAIDDEEVGPVGVRYKGSQGTLGACFDPSTGQQLCPKVSMKVKFDHLDKKKRWKGLKRLNLHALNRDPSLLHERLAYQLFRQMGVPAPRSVHGTVVVNGEELGVYAVTEEIDGRFTADRWPKDGDGNLYKELWPVTAAPERLSAALRTNRDGQRGHEAFLTFVRELSSASAESAGKVLDRWAGLDHLFRYLAVDQLIANWDGVTAFYCDPSGLECGNHNFYFYEGEGRLWLIPWDLDFTFFRPVGAQSSHGLERVPAWNRAPGDCAQRYPAWTSATVAAPGCDPLFRALGEAGHARYADAMRALLDGPFRLDQVHADLDRWAAQLAPAVETDTAISLPFWRQQLARFRDDLEILRLRAELLEAGQEPATAGLRAQGVNDFETVDAYGAASATLVETSPDSALRARLHSARPLAGSADLRAEFELRDDGKNKAWAEVHLLMSTPVAALAHEGQLRLRLASNVEREVRIELGSPAYGSGTAGRFGWRVRVPPGGGEFALWLADLQAPSWAPLPEGLLEVVLAQVSALVFSPVPVGRGPSGLLPAGTADLGWLQVDDVEFLTP